MEEKPKRIVTTLQAIEKVKRYCAMAEHCQEDVRQKLKSYNVDNDKLESIICDLIAEKYIDELRYATAFVKGKTNIKSWGKLKIINELKKKKISQKCIDMALGNISETDFLQKMDILAKKWLKTHQNEPQNQIKQKLFRFLYSKGYSPDEIWNFLNKTNFL